MCCIFTCCGWCIDLIQRLWTFTMACCISSAVCCALVTASMSGIALGYNYSLAEYIDLKETNVSVFLKRGVFDDEIADDMDWRRAGHQPVAGHLKDDNLVTGDSDDSMDDTRRSGSVKSGRRMDDNIFQSDDQNRFEGSLMKLTAKPLDPGITTAGPKSDTDMREVAQNYDPGTIDQLKAVQSLINRRKFNLGQMSTQSGDSIPTAILDEKQLANFPAYPGERPYRAQMGDRRMMELQGPHDNSLRNAVPHQEFAAMPVFWGNPKLPPDQRHTAHPDEEVTWPPPVTPRAGPLRPTRPKPAKTPTFPRARTTETALKAVQKSIDEELQMFREGLIKDRLDQQSVNSADFMKNMMGNLPPRPEGAEDYEEDVKGLPVRRRRYVKVSKATKLNGDTNHTKTDSKFIAEESKLKDASFSKDFSTVLNRVKNFIVTAVSENVLSSNDPTLNLETSTRKLLVKMMKSTIL